MILEVVLIYINKLLLKVYPALCRRTYSSDLSYYIYYSINIHYLILLIQEVIINLFNYIKYIIIIEIILLNTLFIQS